MLDKLGMYWLLMFRLVVIKMNYFFQKFVFYFSNDCDKQDFCKGIFRQSYKLERKLL